MRICLLKFNVCLFSPSLVRLDKEDMNDINNKLSAELKFTQFNTGNENIRNNLLQYRCSEYNESTQ